MFLYFDLPGCCQVVRDQLDVVLRGDNRVLIVESRDLEVPIL